MKTSRISKGNYTITKDGRTFEAFNNDSKQWDLFEIVPCEVYGTKRQWIQTYEDLGSCKIYVDCYL